MHGRLRFSVGELIVGGLCVSPGVLGRAGERMRAMRGRDMVLCWRIEELPRLLIFSGRLVSGDRLHLRGRILGTGRRAVQLLSGGDLVHSRDANSVSSLF